FKHFSFKYWKKVFNFSIVKRIANSWHWYFFSVLKTEMFENFEKSVKKMTLKELERHLNKFIDWYNNERMLKKFNYKTPHELWVEFCKK
ncbi:IS3 family transposase, partial [Mycoplasmopsis bovis]|uniref:IS3 family transposase n=1 Tax=Mycoplasmopsis bovis TaxID=28903 RepID=UPI003D2805AF